MAGKFKEIVGTLVLDRAKAIVNSDRQSEYGDPVENKVRQALVASATLGRSISPEEIVLIELSQKQVRAGRGTKLDTTIDLAGYAEILQRVREAMADGTVQRIVEHLLGGWVQFEQRNPAVLRKDAAIDTDNSPAKDPPPTRQHSYL